MNASEIDPMWMMAFWKQRHVNDGRCASAHLLKDGCLGNNTELFHVTGHVRSAGYNSSGKAVAACHKYAEEMTYWIERYRKTHPVEPHWTLMMKVEQARRARYEEVSA